MSSGNSFLRNELEDALVLLAPRGKSARIPNGDNDLPPSLVLRRDQQHSAQVAQKIRARDPEGLLCDVPGKTRQRWRQGERRRRATRLRRQAAALQTMRREVVRIAPTPRGLRLRAPRRLAVRRRARPLTRSDMPVWHKPATTDTARALPEHAHMLYAS